MVCLYRTDQLQGFKKEQCQQLLLASQMIPDGMSLREQILQAHAFSLICVSDMEMGKMLSRRCELQVGR